MSPRRALRATALAAALAGSACGVPLMKLPTGPGVPAADAGAALDQAAAACRAVRTLTAEIGVSGKVGSERLRARMLAGVAVPAQVFLDAPAPFGASVFQLAARGDDATLLLPRDRRVLEHANTADVIEAIAGIPLSGADLRIALTGCARTTSGDGGQAAGDDWRIIPGEEEIYLHREAANAPWRIVAVVRQRTGGGGWRSEYHDFRNGLPSTVRFISLQAGRFDLRLALSQVETNTTLDENIFRLTAPPGFEPISLDELRQAGPLAEPDRDRQ